MRVAALYDIHGNLPALEAVLEQVRRCDVDQVVIGGDVVPGPMPRECLTCLLNLDVPVQFIQGNGEAAVLTRMAGSDSDKVPEKFRPVIRWVAEQFRHEDEQLMTSWPETLRIGIENVGQVLFCHATPRNNTEIFTRNTTDDRLLPIFGKLDVPLVVCGHTHMQFDRTVGPTRVLNAGSVGMPFGKPGAYWLKLGPDVELRQTPYDVADAAERIGATNYPQAAEFAARNVLRPPSEAEMLDAFARAELTP